MRDLWVIPAMKVQDKHREAAMPLTDGTRSFSCQITSLMVWDGYFGVTELSRSVS